VAEGIKTDMNIEAEKDKLYIENCKRARKGRSGSRCEAVRRNGGENARDRDR
jgi:hypothetical protein